MIYSNQFDGLAVQVYESRMAMAQAAADCAAQVLRNLLKAQDEVNVIFAAAPSQQEMLAALAQADVEFSRVNAFHMDEYHTLAPDAPQRFGHWLDGHFFGLVGLKSVHYLGRSGDTETECQRYTDLLQRYRVDLTLMGIGENGHIAFNDPHEADFHDPRLVRRVTLDETCRKQQVNDGAFPKLTDVPQEALTLTIPALLAAKHAICTVPGAAKANAVQAAVFGPVTTECPASVMRDYENCILFCDNDSGQSLLEQ